MMTATSGPGANPALRGKKPRGMNGLTRKVDVELCVRGGPRSKTRDRGSSNTTLISGALKGLSAAGAEAMSATEAQQCVMSRGETTYTPQPPDRANWRSDLEGQRSPGGAREGGGGAQTDAGGEPVGSGSNCPPVAGVAAMTIGCNALINATQETSMRAQSPMSRDG
jgi:hypothetical protein